MNVKTGILIFHITATAYRPFSKGDRKDNDWKEFNGKNYTVYAGGCLHEEIVAIRPDLQLFVDLHGTTAKGVPYYPIENGFYFIKEGKGDARRYLRLTEEETAIIAGAEDKLHLKYLLYSLNIPARWEAEAKKAIALLEQWTGKTFMDDSKKELWQPPAPEEITVIQERINNGYYSPEKKIARVQVAKSEQMQKLMEKLAKERDKDIQQANDEYNVKIAVLNAGLTLENFIYYNHINTGKFNWLDHAPSVSEEAFNQFLARVDYSQLPEGITFKIK